MNVLVIAAHPDDEVLGCGGTIAKLAEAGDDVSISIFGEGVTSRYEAREDADNRLLRNLHAASEKVAKLLGAKNLKMFNLPDNRFDTVPLLEIVKKIENLVEKFQPEVVYTQHGGDLNIDHVQLFRATLTATRPMQGSRVKAVYAYEVASSTEYAFNRFSPVFRPNVFQDISKTIDLKIEAMQMYESEARPFPHPRSPEALRAIARRWGSQVGREAAEAFELIRQVVD